MDADKISEIVKAKRYAEEPERIQFTTFEAKLRGDKGFHSISFDNGMWSCTCEVFHRDGDCQHTMAMLRVLGVTLPREIHATLMKQLPQEEYYPISSTINVQDIRIRINEIPLKPQNLVNIVSAFTEIYTKCWLIVRGRFADLIEYSQTRNGRFADEANLVISKVTQNSPINIDWKLDASPQGLILALATGVEAIAQIPRRIESATLDNRAKELTLKLKELEAQEDLTDKEQARQIAAQKAELERQATLLGIERQRLELIAKRLEIEKMRIDYVLEIAGNMVTILRPSADEETKVMLLQTLIPSLLQLGEGRGLELVLPVAQKDNAIAEEQKEHK